MLIVPSLIIIIPGIQMKSRFYLSIVGLLRICTEKVVWCVRGGLLWSVFDLFAVTTKRSEHKSDEDDSQQLAVRNEASLFNIGDITA